MTEKREEDVRVAFAIWEQLTALDLLLRKRYFDEFADIIDELETKRISSDTETYYPF